VAEGALKRHFRGEALSPRAAPSHGGGGGGGGSGGGGGGGSGGGCDDDDGASFRALLDNDAELRAALDRDDGTAFGALVSAPLWPIMHMQQ